MNLDHVLRFFVEIAAEFPSASAFTVTHAKLQYAVFKCHAFPESSKKSALFNSEDLHVVVKSGYFVVVIPTFPLIYVFQV